MNFERGKDPIRALDLGWKKVLEEMGGRIFYEKDLYQNINNQFFTLDEVRIQNIKSRRGRGYLFEASLIIVVIGSHFKILKNRFSNECGGIYKCKDLPQMIFDLKRTWDKYRNIIEEK